MNLVFNRIAKQSVPVKGARRFFNMTAVGVTMMCDRRGKKIANRKDLC